MSRILRVVLALAALSATTALAPSGVSAQSDCVTATITQQPGLSGFAAPGDPARLMWVPGNVNTWRSVNFWSNWPEINQQERKLDLLAPGQYVELLGGGTVAEWPAHCQRQAQDGWNRNPLPYASIARLGEEEWLCCDSSVVEQWFAYWEQQSQVQATTTAQEGCPPARPLTFRERTTIEIPGPALVHPWWNNGRTGWGQDPGRSTVNRGEKPTFVEVQGSAWLYNDTEACQANLASEFNNAPHLAIRQMSDLRSRGLVR